MSFEPDRIQPEPVGALQSQVRPLPVHHCSWYRTTLFSLFSFLSLESCGSPSCPNNDAGSAGLCSPGFGDCRLKFQGVLKTDARKTSRLLYKKKKKRKKGTPCSHLCFPYFLGNHSVCSLFPEHCALLLFRGCTADPSLVKMQLFLGRKRVAWGSKECCCPGLCSCRNYSWRLSWGSCCSSCLGLCPLHQLSLTAATV